MNTQLQCSAFTAIIAFTADVIIGNIELTKNISTVSSNSTNNKTVHETSDSEHWRKYIITLIIGVVGCIIFIILFWIKYIGFDNIINIIRNRWRNTMYRLRNWRRYLQRNRPEPPVRHDLNGGIEIIERKK
ncbi:uncharacterized protein LOC105432195 [Pogonomyrmex barbatus]|uniref:Uncharacterized protein LOC105432195 n=1 Tax=Pogonomyrmex barbatus TaxID=144034 RepID=A0A6I9WPU5_9HYME|nr:uncharacterized protein LOC105432195 [Pogonomyrmex barbatus]